MPPAIASQKLTSLDDSVMDVLAEGADNAPSVAIETRLPIATVRKSIRKLKAMGLVHVALHACNGKGVLVPHYELTRTRKSA